MRSVKTILASNASAFAVCPVTGQKVILTKRVLETSIIQGADLSGDLEFANVIVLEDYILSFERSQKR